MENYNEIGKTLTEYSNLKEQIRIVKEDFEGHLGSVKEFAKLIANINTADQVLDNFGDLEKNDYATMENFKHSVNQYKELKDKLDKAHQRLWELGIQNVS